MLLDLVVQLDFARCKFRQVLVDLPPEDAVIRLHPMNCISWMVGHLANHEQSYWLVLGQRKIVVPDLTELVGYGRPATTPPLVEMVAAWEQITAEADLFLATLTEADLSKQWIHGDGRVQGEPVGMMFMRLIYHYWFHIGEIHAVRQQLGHEQLPDFVGDMEMLRPFF